LKDNKCIAVCGDEYLAVNNVCEPCPPNCKTCTGGEGSCTGCTSGAVLAGGKCLVGCVTGFYANNSECTKCPDECLTCENASKCTACKATFFLKSDKCGSCKETSFY